MKNNRGAVDPVTLMLIGALAAGMVMGGWKPGNIFKKKPDTEQLTKLQAELDAAQKAAEQAKKDKEAGIAAERAKLEAQIRSAQADNVGTETALKKVKEQTPETRLASRMAQRVSFKLAAAVGRLPSEDQEHMIELIEQALSDKQAEVDEANHKLALMDAEFKALTGEREKLKAQIPLLEERARKAAETASLKESEVQSKTEEIKQVANKLFRADQERGSLWNNIQRGIILAAIAYLFITFGIPGIIKHLSSNNPVKALLRDASGYLSSPLLYHDAKKKLKEKDATNGP